jgi:hypothetical protein
LVVARPNAHDPLLKLLQLFDLTIDKDASHHVVNDLAESLSAIRMLVVESVPHEGVRRIIAGDQIAKLSNGDDLGEPMFEGVKARNDKTIVVAVERKNTVDDP